MNQSNSWEKPVIMKLATDINAELYSSVKAHFHHGQMARFLQTVIYSVSILIKEKRMIDIYHYISKEKDLILPIKEKE